MSATTWFIIAIVGFSLSGIALITAIFMFIKLNIRGVIGDLSGKTLAREVQAIRENRADQSAKLRAGAAKPRVEAVDASLQAAAHKSKRLDRTASGGLKGTTASGGLKAPAPTPKPQETETLSSHVAEVNVAGGGTEVLPQNQGTAILTQPQETEILSQGQGTEVLTEAGGTQVLSAPMTAPGGTTILDDATEAAPAAPVSFTVVRTEIRIHTDEVI